MRAGLRERTGPGLITPPHVVNWLTGIALASLLYGEYLALIPRRCTAREVWETEMIWVFLSTMLILLVANPAFRLEIPRG